MSNDYQLHWQPLNPAPRPAPLRRASWFARHQILSTIVGLVALTLISVQAPGVSSLGGESMAAQFAPQIAEPGSGPAPLLTPRPTQAAAQLAPPAEVPAPSAAIGARVRTGDFEFLVTSVQRGVGEVGNEFRSLRASGQFILVTLKVRNLGAEPQPLFDANQRLIDSSGRTYAPSSAAEIHLGGNTALFNDLQAQEEAGVTLVYDLPKDATPAAIHLHDTLASKQGVVITLS